MVHPSERGHLKQVLLKLGWPAEDLAGYVDGEAHPIALRRGRLGGARLPAARPPTASSHGGSGVVVLPCGAGKTIVGAAAMARAGATTLILVTNTVAARQWRDELLKRTTADRGRDRRVLRPTQGDPAGHDRDVPGDDHAPEGRLRRTSSSSTRATGASSSTTRCTCCPAPIFRFTADIQARRRLGLTATLVREDGREGDVFSLIGPEALRRAVEGHRGAGLHRAGRLRRGARHARPSASGSPTRRPSRRSATASRPRPPAKMPRGRGARRTRTRRATSS